MTKNIKDYLHLYLGCEVATTFNDHTYTLLGIERDNAIVWREQIGRTVKLIGLIKPLLRPLSDMTVGEKAGFITICQLEPEDIECVEMTAILTDKPELGTAHLTNIHQWARGTNYLRSIGVDCDELIEAGLAIDKTKMNQPA